MFIVNLTYVTSLDAVEAALAGHREFLAKQYQNGTFLLSGRKEPRTGGIILAKADSMAHLQQVLADDPFRQQGIANYEIIEFHPTMSAAGLHHLQDI